MQKLISITLLYIIFTIKIGFAETVDVTGNIIIPYKSGFFSSNPSDKSNQEAMKLAKEQAWLLYTSRFNDAKMKIYQNKKDILNKKIDDFIQNVKIIDKKINKEDKTVTLAIRVTVNETAVNALINNESSASKQKSGEGEPFVFLFLAREASSIKSYDDKVVKVNKSESVSGTQDAYDSNDKSDVEINKIENESKITTGGSTERKRSKISYEVTSSQDVDAAISNVLSTGGFEIISYDDVVASCGGVDKKLIQEEFKENDDVSTETRKAILNSTRDCEAVYFATGTIDIGVQDTDPVSGLKRVTTSVRGQVWNITKKLPRKVASVGPIQYSGLGQDDQVAKRNALTLSADAAAKVILDQLNLKDLK